MKQFIRYLYEYEQGRRIRNVGFVKVEQNDEEAVVHIHGKGLRLEGERRLAMYLFYEEDGACIGVRQGEVENVNPAVNYRLRYTKEDTGRPENFPRIDGIILETGAGRRYAAVWDDMPVDVNRMQKLEDMPKLEPGRLAEERRPAEPERSLEPERSSESMHPYEPEGAAEEAGQETVYREEAASQEGAFPQEESATREEAFPQSEPDMGGTAGEESAAAGGADPAQSQETVTAADDKRQEDEAFAQEAQASRRRLRARKIQRKDLVNLPRCEWKLSNNSFLLHGYYNYRHLVFIEDGENLKLGVPGIYHEKEANAAGAFGFGEFIPAGDLEVSLNGEEMQNGETFGYWCRSVRHYT